MTAEENMEKKEPSYTVDGNENWCHYVKQYGSSPKN